MIIYYRHSEHKLKISLDRRLPNQVSRSNNGAEAGFSVNLANIMTLLISVAHPEYSLSVSDQRITTTYFSRTKIIDEKFNKHIYFGTEHYVGNISYTGLAQWRLKGVRYRLYDVISSAISSIISSNPKLSELCVNLLDHFAKNIPDKKIIGIDPYFELHIVTRHKEIPLNTITVISTFRRSPPWGSTDGLIYEWQLGPVMMYMKCMFEESDVIFGGMENYISQKEKIRLRQAINSGADAFQFSQMASKIVEIVSSRTPTVGPTSVSIVIPAKGYFDTNLWRNTGDVIIGYIPRIIFPNGTTWGPSEFPVSLSVITEGYLPKHSLFFKTIIYQKLKKRLRRVIFRRRKGLKIPGLMGLVGMALFGSIIDGYEDFGLGANSDE